MTPDRADFHLQNWAAWQRGEQNSFLKLHSESLESGYARGTDVDEMYAVECGNWARITDTVVYDLPTHQRDAIMAFYLGVTWRRAGLLMPVVDDARVAVARNLEARHVV